MRTPCFPLCHGRYDGLVSTDPGIDSGLVTLTTAVRHQQRVSFTSLTIYLVLVAIHQINGKLDVTSCHRQPTSSSADRLCMTSLHQEVSISIRLQNSRPPTFNFTSVAAPGRRRSNLYRRLSSSH